MVFYDLKGQPIAYTDDDEHIYLFTGEAVAYLYDNAVYSYSGKQLGWFNRGWIRDMRGCCTFFTETADGSGPMKPAMKTCSFKRVQHTIPLKILRQPQPILPVDRFGWSTLSGRKFFEQ